MPPKTSRKKEEKVAKSKRRQPKQEGSVAGAAGQLVAVDEHGREQEAERLFQLSIKYMDGNGVEQSDEQAARYCRWAAELGHAGAQHNLGFFFREGRGVLQDFAEAARWYRLASNQGQADALAHLAEMYSHGNGVPQDAVEAARLHRLAADAGIADAQFCLGCLYRDGRGVGQDYAEAVRWYHLAAAQDHAKAQCDLGTCYAAGAGVPKDYDEARRLFEPSATQGVATAFLCLGKMFEQGVGVEKNLALAKQYYRRAGKKTDKDVKLHSGKTTIDVMKEQLDTIKHTCSSCKAVGDGLKVCTRCKGPRYCGVACQRKDWPEHKRVCQRLAKTEVVDRMAQRRERLLIGNGFATFIPIFKYTQETCSSRSGIHSRAFVLRSRVSYVSYRSGLRLYYGLRTLFTSFFNFAPLARFWSICARDCAQQRKLCFCCWGLCCFGTNKKEKEREAAQKKQQQR